MGRAVFRKAWADLRGHRLQGLLIFLTITAATATLTVSLVTQAGAERPYERAFEANNGAHVVFYAFPFVEGNDVVADLSTVAEMPGVSATAGPVPVVFGGSLIHDGLKYQLDLAALGGDPPAVGKPVVTEGVWIEEGAVDQVLLTRDFARELGIEVGDAVELIGRGGTPQPATVVGLTVDVSRGPYPETDPIGYVPEATLERVVPNRSTWGSALAVQLDDPQAVDPFVAQVFRAHPNSPLDIDTWTDVREQYVIWTQVFSILLGLFAAFAMVAVGMIVANVIGARVLAQFRDIGMLKAIGFTPGQVTRVFLIQHLLLALAGAVAGITIGTALAPLMLRRTAEALNTTTDTAFNPLLSLSILLGTLLVVALFTWLPARRGARITTVQAIAAGAGSASSRPSLLARLALRLRLTPVVALGLKDAFARPWRAVMTIVALALTTVTFIFTLGTQETLDGILNDPALEGDVFDVDVSPAELDAVTTEAILAGHPEIANLYTSTGVFVRPVRGGSAPQGQGMPDEGFIARGMEGGYATAGFLVPEGRMFAAPDEAVAGRGLLDMYGLNIGDTITFGVVDPADGETVAGTLTLRIVGRYVTDDNEGREIMFPRETLLTVLPDSEPRSYAIQLEPGADLKEFQRSLYQESNYDFRMETGLDDTPPEVGILRRVLYGLSAVLLVIGMINLVSTTLLNVRERRRDYGIGKALGLTPRQITGSVVTGVSALALIAAVIGIPVGILVYRLFFEIIAVGMLEADPELYAGPLWWQLVLLLPGAVVVAALASGLPARFAARVKVADALRYE